MCEPTVVYQIQKENCDIYLRNYSYKQIACREFKNLRIFDDFISFFDRSNTEFKI